MRLLRVDVIGANDRQRIGTPATSTTEPAGAREFKNVEVQANLALTPGETSLEVVLDAPDSLGGRRSLIMSPGTSTAKPLVAAGGAPRSETSPATPTTPPGSGLTGGPTIVPPGGIAKYSSKAPSVIVSWVPPGTSPVFLSATRAYLKEGADQTLTVTAEGPTPPALVEHGALPKGTSWSDNGNGTATVSGIPLVSGVYPLTITATDSGGRSTSERLNLIVSRPVPPKTGKPVPSPPTPTTVQVSPAPRTSAPATPAPQVRRPHVTTPQVTTPRVTTPPVTSPPTSAARPVPTTSAPAHPTTTTPPRSEAPSRPHSKPVQAPATPAPTITSPASATMVEDSPGSFRITASPSASVRLSERGPIPPGVAFTAEGLGTATLSGRPTRPGTYHLTVVASNTSGVSATQVLTLTVIQTPAVTSPTTATFITGTAGSFTITATGTPTPTLTQQGPLPAGLSFHANTNGTATLTGTPTGDGIYPITVTASNAVGAAFTQHLSVEVAEAPSITAPGAASFTQRVPGTFTIAAVGWPTPAFSVQGALPPGLAFRDNGDGTATLAGTPTEAGHYLFDVTAENHIGAPSVHQVSVAVRLTPTTIKLRARRLGATVRQNTLGLTAVVDPPGSVPTGTVTFFDRRRKLGAATLNNLGAATLTVNVPVGNHLLTASYDPASGSGFAASSTTPFGFIATPAPAASSTNRTSPNHGPLATTGAQIRLALEIGGAVLLLGAAAVWVAFRIRRRHPSRPA